MAIDGVPRPFPQTRSSSSVLAGSVRGGPTNLPAEMDSAMSVEVIAGQPARRRYCLDHSTLWRPGGQA